MEDQDSGPTKNHPSSSDLCDNSHSMQVLPRDPGATLVQITKGSLACHLGVTFWDGQSAGRRERGANACDVFEFGWSREGLDWAARTETTGEGWEFC